MTPAQDDDAATILVVDDTEVNRDLLVRRLQRQGHRTQTADNGLQALALLQQCDVDLLLLDIMMPEMNGFELLERLKTDARLRHVPVILILALDDEDSMVRGIAMGADDYLPKPFNRHLLNARVGASLARKRLHDREQMHARSLERELEIARQIQSGFLPKTLPEVPGWELAAGFQPARRVGGDFYDAFELGDGRLVLALGDVCDKGVGAALFMALFRSLLRALAERLLAPPAPVSDGLAELLSSINAYIDQHHGEAGMFATLFCAVVDAHGGALVFVNAGHEPPWLVGAAGVRARLASTGPAVGMWPGVRYRVGHESLAGGEALVAVTDGITESRNPQGEPFSDERLQALLALPAPSVRGWVARIDESVRQHAQGAAQFDDITLLVLRRQADTGV